MAGNAPFGTDSTPEVVVKIIGSKLVTFFVEKPRRNKAVRIETQSLISPPALSPLLHSTKAVTDQVPPDKLSTPKGNTEMREPGQSAEQTPAKQPSEHLDVYCVTAPTGDQTLSYIHCQKKPLQRTIFTTNHTEPPHAELLDPAPSFSSALLTVVSREMHCCSTRALESMGEELQRLDPTHSGVIHQSQLGLAFLRHEVPLKLTTLRLLFQTFAGSTCPDQVNYKELVGFLLRAMQKGGPDAHDEKRSNSLKQSQQVKEALTSGTNMAGKRGMNSEKLHQSFQQSDDKTTGQLLSLTTEDDGSLGFGAQVQRFSKSTGTDRKTVYTQESETWLERFSQLERAMRMCDDRNTGMLEKGEAKHLIHNYNLIFNLNLSPLRIEQALHIFETHGEVTLDSVLQYLKKL
ncbi:uncharacterized protein C1orf87 homolog isoform X1 [Acipenser ruthenus]|uniref:uncharacterized protein C1orf87 homolog isoform X1 n=1 Tax=Acipenser ruthenus TaxID=7906 RepID=UPI002741F56B|nr:uncharacterized protein C1orf87 homolog isoform X1 [Acipenser ruthenus]